MLTFDAFPFFMELDLLDIRLHELNSVVDFFVLVEATTTHSGKPKPLYYQENRKRFRRFWDKIVPIVVDDMPITPDEIKVALLSRDKEWLESDYQTTDSWVRERYQRNAIMRGLTYASPDDMIIIGDADEIVRATVVEECKPLVSSGKSVAIKQDMYSYYLNVACSIPWWGSKILQKKMITTPSEDRFHTKYPVGIENGGWHWNFLGNANTIKTKIMSYAHTEFDTPEILSNVDERLKNLQDVLGRKDAYYPVPIDKTFPKYLRYNLKKFSHLIYKVDE